MHAGHALHATTVFIFFFYFIILYIPGNATNIDIYNTNHIYKNIKFIFDDKEDQFKFL